MNPEIKTKWLAALRSGTYRQRTAALKGLRNGPVFCVIGVLCDILVSEKILEEIGVGIYVFQNVPPFFMNIPSPVEDFLGIPKKLKIELTQLNDVSHWEFPQLADWIETHIP